MTTEEILHLNLTDEQYAAVIYSGSVVKTQI